MKHLSLAAFVVLFLMTTCNLKAAPKLPKSNPLQNGTADIILAVGLFNGTIQVWRVSDETLLHILSHPQALPSHSVTSIAITPNGHALASTTGYEVRVWRLSDGQILHTFASENIVR